MRRPVLPGPGWPEVTAFDRMRTDSFTNLGGIGGLEGCFRRGTSGS